jgi:hypothetical protein
MQLHLLESAALAWQCFPLVELILPQVVCCCRQGHVRMAQMPAFLPAVTVHAFGRLPPQGSRGADCLFAPVMDQVNILTAASSWQGIADLV